MQVLTDPAECGPVTLALCQDVQAEAFDYPESFFAERVWTSAPAAARTRDELDAAVAALKAAKKPVIIAGGGVLYSEAPRRCAPSPRRTASRSMETQAGKSRLPHDHPLNMGSVGVTGSSAVEPARRGGRCGARRRHAAAGFHHRLLGAVQGRAA